ncbi:MAG: hypothetical protein ACWGO1_14055, partial [Anaerolineales bacterium]
VLPAQGLLIRLPKEVCMRREMKLPILGLRQSVSQNQFVGIISKFRVLLVRAVNAFHQLNEIPVGDCSQMAAAAGISCYSIRQKGSLPR